MQNNIKSKMWKVYHIPEFWIKFYVGMDMNKTRPGWLVCDNATLLHHKCIVIELTTKGKTNPHRIKWYSCYSVKYGCIKTCYILPNRIYTIDRKLLVNNLESHNKNNTSLSGSLKFQIFSFITKLFITKKTRT